MPIYDFKCPHCSTANELTLSIGQYDDWSNGIVEPVVRCESCDGLLGLDNRVISAASVTRASFVDGTRRKGFAERKEAIKLKGEMYNMKPEDRGDVKKVIKELEKR